MNETVLMTSPIFVQNFSKPTIESWFIPLDIVTILCSTLCIILCCIYLLIILLNKRCHTVPMKLTSNSCLTILISESTLLGLSVFTLENDLKQIQFQDSLCIVRAYIVNSLSAPMHYSFLLESVYRYNIVISPTRLFFQSSKFQILAICLTWILGFLYPLPYMLTGQILYNVQNQICQVPLRFSLPVVYSVFCNYIIPVSIIMFIYFKLVRHIKQISKRVTPVNTLSRAKKQLKMVRRTVTLITMVATVCFPLTVFAFITFFGDPPKYHFRIAYATGNISMVFVMITLFQFTDPLKASVINRIKPQPNMVVARLA